MQRVRSRGEGNVDEHMLVGDIRFHVKRHGAAVESGAENFRAEADGGVKVETERAVARKRA